MTVTVSNIKCRISILWMERTTQGATAPSRTMKPEALSREEKVLEWMMSVEGTPIGRGNGPNFLDAKANATRSVEVTSPKAARVTASRSTQMWSQSRRIWLILRYWSQNRAKRRCQKRRHGEWCHRKWSQGREAETSNAKSHHSDVITSENRQNDATRGNVVKEGNIRSGVIILPSRSHCDVTERPHDDATAGDSCDRPVSAVDLIWPGADASFV